MNILITGGNGYIGRFLARYFSGENIIKTTRTPKDNDERCLVLEDEKTARGVCKDIDIVIHTASMDERDIPANPKTALLSNTYGTRSLYIDAAENNVKAFIYLSTFHVYGDVNGEVTEDSRTNPKNDYGLTHLFAEQYLRQLNMKYKIPTAVIRLTNGVGLPDSGVDKWYLVLNDFCRSAVRDGKIVLKSNGLPRRDFIDINDICTAVDTLVHNMPEFDIYNISSERTHSIRELAVKVCEVYEGISGGKKIEFSAPDVSEDEIKAVTDFCVKSEKLRKLGWKPRVEIGKTIETILRAEMRYI